MSDGLADSVIARIVRQRDLIQAQGTELRALADLVASEFGLPNLPVADAIPALAGSPRLVD